ncbi:hypothetical protein [uncultured Tateyamaria sp.]|uniref:hypothetical protein n=1 Tax=uncultured Tateyamaria sp. TaxID=455651 RepID=UPI00262AFBA0|nr:hypothetical protein [uncultured Tateyamaria sp.]
MKRIIWLTLAALVAAILFYLSRFWTFSLWPRDGLFGIEALRPQGSLLGRWLRGTDFAPFELLIWAVGVFLVLSILQKLYDLLNPPPE